MPRNSRSRSSGPSVQRRPAHTAATPAPAPAPAHQPAPMAPSPGGGLMSNIVGTAAGVGIGSVVGHGISNALFGGSSSAPAPVEASPQAATGYAQQAAPSCAIQAKDFTSCLQATNNDMNSCGYYLEQLKACQSAAAPY